MARKRYKTKRMDYRKGGRVTYAKGGKGARPIKGNTSKPKPGDYGSKDEYQIALQQYRDSRPTATAPAVTPPAPVARPPVRVGAPVTKPAGKAASTVDAITKEIEARKIGTPPAQTSAPVVNTRVTSEEPDLSGGSDGRNNPAGGVGASGASGGRGPDRPKKVTPKTTTTTVDPKLKQFEDERAARIIESGRTAEKIAAGEIPAGAIPKPDVAQVNTRLDIDDTYTIPYADRIKSGTIAAAPEYATSTISDTARVAAPDQIQAGTMEASLVGQSAEATGVTGTVSDEAIAEAAQITQTPSISEINVEVKQGALAQQVTGVLSPGALATAAQAAGTTLSKVTRAKRQLRNAGVAEESITALGNDPEALEASLLDLTQEERGVIGDLPEEALVSNQLDSLLKGMENGDIPTWASPAVAAVEQMLARRGLEASSVGRDNLFNAIIQSAVPLAQSNAQAIQASVAQTRDIESREELANAQMQQQTAMQNASNVFQMDMAQFSADQQTTLSNSKFLQTVSLTEASSDQQAAIQNALILSQTNMQQASLVQQSAISNAKTFLTMDQTNLSNKQQAAMVTTQYQQQTLLSDQSAQNAAAQFNATSENQTNQFMAGLATQVNQYNASALNQAKQINAQMENATLARQADRVVDVNKANAAMLNQTAQFNSQLDFNRNQWNAANKQAVENSNVNWRRSSNQINTAAQNAVNQQNAQNAFGMSQSALSFLWQELRDQADYDFKWANNNADRKNQAMVAAASAEGDAAKNWSTNYNAVSKTIDTIFGTGG